MKSVGSDQPASKKSVKKGDSRPYLCMMCPKRFAAAGYLRQHIRRHVDTGDHSDIVDIEKHHRSD